MRRRGRSSCSPGSSGHWEACEPSTAGHTDRVADISVRCAEAMGLPTARREVVRIDALLHGVGRLRIRDEVLTGDGKPTSAALDIPGTLAGGQLDADVVAALQGLYAAGRLDDLLQHGP